MGSAPTMSPALASAMSKFQDRPGDVQDAPRMYDSRGDGILTMPQLRQAVRKLHIRPTKEEYSAILSAFGVSSDELDINAFAAAVLATPSRSASSSTSRPQREYGLSPSLCPSDPDANADTLCLRL